MAGVKGRSGGARAGAGRKKKEAALTQTKDSKEFLTQAMQGLIDPNPAQLKAAIALLAVQHPKMAPGKPQAPEKPLGNKFAVRQAPRLVSSR